ncbi:filamentous hemagglutinin N-terminal domain-containing protein [Acinetobacter equi]|uniref:Filamentous haemagglutinin FhaB/tRNA nuclease CdiA-like TPS domain-containing protein n=1 Tax=Acinetobacter equi TaxID=1324350 RepID=A0A0N9W501_9GAMM|nr:filamentous hemagglutinin N-terminal domain-containing protein [Acinetobacter equi]ALH96278.1 hypothetical protein AOY20_12435 [Acinetobacter equi]
MFNKKQIMKLNPLTVSILFALPMTAQAANIQMVNGSNIASTNGVPVININQANSNGISHNIYDRLNVGREGVIFNNSQNGANTVLAGQIAGNANLASGTASVILNEVTSRNASTLNGMMEVAGDKAQLIIANPNGITCNDCGFINSESVTLTTGTPDLVNGELKGYSVNGGKITTNGLTSDSPTAILARSIVVNGEIHADQQLDLIAGNNYVDTNNNVTGTVRSSGSRNTYSIDVAKLGGMYSDKINLVSTESGVGVRNQGNIVGQVGGIKIDANGRLLNNNAKITSTGDLVINTNGSVENKSGYIAGVNAVEINTNRHELVNSGQGTNVGIQGGEVVLTTGKLNNHKGQIQGDNISSDSTSLHNHNGVINSRLDLDITSTGTIENISGLLRAAHGGVYIVATNSTLKNKKTDSIPEGSEGIVAGKGGISIDVNHLDNQHGYMQTIGDVGITSTGSFHNSHGNVYADGNIDIQAKLLSNSYSNIVAGNKININLDGNLTNKNSLINGDQGIIINAHTLHNEKGQIIADNAAINIDLTHDLHNDHGLIRSGNTNELVPNVGNRADTVTGATTIKAGHKISNNYGTIYSTGDMSLDSDYLHMSGSGSTIKGNAKGFIVADGALDINVRKGDVHNHGWIVGKEKLTMNVNGYLKNYNTIYSEQDIDITTGKAIYNSASILSGRSLSLTSGSYIKNGSTIYSDGTTNIDATYINNTSRSSILGGGEGLELNNTDLRGNGLVFGL